MHKNGYLTYLKPQEKSSSQKQTRPQTLNLSTENLCPKKLLILVAEAEEDVEQEDMAYTVGSLRLP
jgi:hypothetical protein